MSVIPPAGQRESRVLILAPTANDSRMTAGLLDKEGISVQICRDLEDLCAKLEEGCGTLLLAEETLAGGGVVPLVETLSRQPPWSDLPITVITSGGEVSQTRLRRLGVFGPGGNVTLLERPFRPATLISTVEVALRARRRQYEVRGLLEELKTGEERLQGILDSISDAFVAIDRDWRITYVNSGYLRLISPLYESADQLVGKDLWERFPETVGTEVESFYRRMMNETTPASLENFFAPLDLWFEVRAFPSATGLSLYVQNINARKKSESEQEKLYDEIRKNADRLNLAMGAASLGDWSWEIETDLMSLSDRAAEIFGLAAGAQLTRDAMRDLLHEDDREPARIASARAVQTGTPYENEYRVRHADGTLRWVAARGAGIFDAAGKMTGMLGVVQDITRRKRNEAELTELTRQVQDQANTFYTTLSNISDFAYTFDCAGRFIYANKPLLDLLGRSLDEVVGRNFHDLEYPTELADRLQEQIASVFDTGEPVRDETPFTGVDGEEGFYEYIFSPVYDPAGRISIVAGFTRDISERKRREAEVANLTDQIAKQAILFDSTLSNIADLVYSFDREGRVIYANRALLEVWGRTLDEVVGKNVFDLEYPEELGKKIHAQLLEVIATGQPIRGETLFHDSTGAEDIHDYIFNPAFDEDGKVIAVVGTTRVVTEHRRAEGARRQLAAIVESSDDAIVSKTLEGVIVTWNAGAQRLFGYAPEEAIGQPVTMLIPEERHDEEPAIVSRVSRGEPIQHYETVRLRKDGSKVAVSLSVSPIRDGEGRVIGASKIARDITLQKQTEQALKEAKETAESANRSKDHFLAVLSHELRTPLNPVLMTASALEMDPKLSPELRTDMAMIRRNVELETKLIDDLLDLSRITTGKLALHARPIDLNEAVRQVGAICEQQVAEKGMRLQLELDAKAGHVRADPARLQQVLWNILKNAAKFTPEGGSISVSTRRESDDTVRIAVRDTGIGIAPEVLPKIFEAFEQGDSRINRQFGGLGLGLAITKALVMLHDGKIRAESDGVGKGSTFIIELPSASSERRAGPEGVEERQMDGALRILIVEDHIDTATMLARLLGASGYQVMVANTAARGLEIYRKQEFDIVVSDIGLPDATGYDFMRALRAIREIKGIAMSGYGMEEDIRKSLEAGFNEHLVKPVNLLSLEQAIRRLASTMRTKDTPRR